MNFPPVEVYLGLGSNLGDRENNLQEAVRLLSGKLHLGKVSSVYETEPVGDAAQPLYLNQVCQAHITLPPEQLLTLVKGFELKMGRTGSCGASRIIDIDILLYGDQVVKTPVLVIPHPRLTERAFALMPLAEIAPGVVHPVNHKTVNQLLRELKDKHGVIKLKEVFTRSFEI